MKMLLICLLIVSSFLILIITLIEKYNNRKMKKIKDRQIEIMSNKYWGKKLN